VTTPRFIDPLEAIIAQIQDDSVPTRWAVLHRLPAARSTAALGYHGQPTTHAHGKPAPEIAPMRLHKSDDRLVVEYAEPAAREGERKIRLAFARTIAVIYRDLPSHVSRAQAQPVRCVLHSAWLAEILRDWRESAVAGHGRALPYTSGIFRHYIVMAAEGRIDIAASDYRVI
jgi:hypothetical protein